MKLYLGVFSHKDESSFSFTGHIENCILDTKEINDDGIDKVSSFLIGSCELKLRPCLDYNKCFNIIKFLYSKYSVISLDDLNKIQGFMRMYRGFPVYIRLNEES
jgi:hypothetical protein